MRFTLVTLIVIVSCVLHLSCTQTLQPATPAPAPPAAAAFDISEISIDPAVFNPSGGQQVTIGCRLSRHGRAIVSIFGRDQRLIQELVPINAVNRYSDRMIYRWDGRDLEGHLVADGAYGLTIRAADYKGNHAEFDSFEQGGNQYMEIEAQYDAAGGRITYDLPEPARVSIRVGIAKGPMLNNLLGWRPRLAGSHAEPWNGRDASDNLEVFKDKRAYLVAEAVTLPLKVIIAQGNNQYGWATYVKQYAHDRPMKEKKSSMVIRRGNREIVYQQMPPGGDRIDVRITLTHVKYMRNDGAAVIDERTKVKVHLSDRSKQAFIGERYEIICFINNQFSTEFEEGFSPTTWMLDIGSLSAGAHTLVVNVATLTGQMGSASKRIYIEH